MSDTLFNAVASQNTTAGPANCGSCRCEVLDRRYRDFVIASFSLARPALSALTLTSLATTFLFT